MLDWIDLPEGRARAVVAGEAFELTPYDALYIPRDSDIEVAAFSGGCDLAEFSAPVERRYPLQFVSYPEVRHRRRALPSARPGTGRPGRRTSTRI
jgi:5-deoxy-D-glucuronate isomerase